MPFPSGRQREGGTNHRSPKGAPMDRAAESTLGLPEGGALRGASTERRPSIGTRAAWDLQAHVAASRRRTRVLGRRTSGGPHAVARSLVSDLPARRSRPHGRGTGGSLLRRADAPQNADARDDSCLSEGGSRGTRGRELCESTATRAGEDRRLAGCAHGSCGCRSRMAAPDPAKLRRVTLLTARGPARWPGI